MRVVQGLYKNGPARLVAQQAQVSCALSPKEKVQAWKKMEKTVGACECGAQRNGPELVKNPPLPNIDQTKLQAQLFQDRGESGSGDAFEEQWFKEEFETGYWQGAQACQTLRRILAFQQRGGSGRIMDAEAFNTAVKPVLMPAPDHGPRGPAQASPP